MRDKAHAAFLSKDPRQLVARDTRRSSTDPLVFMKQGGADGLREAARQGHFACPVPGCESPRLTVVGPRLRRHHFRHLTAPSSEHGLERLAHIQGKYLIGAWASERYPEASVHIDDQHVESGQLPDVLVEFPDGRRFAFEIQYSPLTAKKWRERHDAFAGQGITDVWLFGHTPPTYKERPDEYDGVVRPVLTDLLREVLIARVPIAWINPFQELIGTGIPCRHDLLYLRHPRAQDPAKLDGRLTRVTNALSEAWIDGRQFLTPGLEKARLATAHFVAEGVPAARKQREERREQRAERRRQIARHEQSRRDYAAREAFKERLRQQERDACGRLHAELFPDGDAPGAIVRVNRRDRCVWRLTPLWKAEAFARLIRGRIGTTFVKGNVGFPLINEKQDERLQYLVWEAVTAFLEDLRREGFVEFRMEGGRIKNPIRVVSEIGRARSVLVPHAHDSPAADAGRARPGWDWST